MATARIGYRQEVETFRRRLDAILAGAGPRKGRIRIDTTGYRSRAVPSKTLEQALARYGARRFESVSRVLALFETARRVERLDQRGKRLRAVPSGAVWQAYAGTEDANACHTCPCHLQIDGHWPTSITTNRSLQRHLIIEFADCMLMPRAINEVDIAVDDIFGRAAFATAAQAVLNEPGTGWREATERFRDEARDLLGPMLEILFGHAGGRFRPDDADDRLRLDALGAYYEGLFLTPINERAITAFIVEVRREMGA